ncbi:hypothetical protein [Streptomyces profundus]|uniref:hypothetical protein n=1 Tax=Streptomyces profundus TaxID=2867410 RepID=UPI001D168B91|nr:hypothetical protein [Streptomyces sp. MA3_2.13]UED87801.1 hypothetical protein K4G22_29365 [Streptomyces sp. MA3_2.13]
MADEHLKLIRDALRGELALRGDLNVVKIVEDGRGNHRFEFRVPPAVAEEIAYALVEPTNVPEPGTAMFSTRLGGVGVLVHRVSSQRVKLRALGDPHMMWTAMLADLRPATLAEIDKALTREGAEPRYEAAP